MNYQPFDKNTASVEDRIAWALCQIIDDDAPLRWTRYRFAAQCIAHNPEVMSDLADEYECSAAKWPANRQLIAAAPDLLEACKVASALLNGAPRSLGYDFDAKQLDAAIAKATGEQA